MMFLRIVLLTFVLASVWSCFTIPFVNSIGQTTTAEYYKSSDTFESQTSDFDPKVILQGDMPEVIDYISKLSDINIKDFKEATPLHYAAIRGDVSILEKIIQMGAKLDPQDSIGDTPLIYASRYGNMEVFSFLLKNGAELSRANSSGETAEFIFTLKNLEEIAKNGDFLNKLTALNIDHLKYKDALLTELLKDSISSNNEVIFHLLEKGAKLTDRDTMVELIASKRFDVVAKIFENGYDITEKEINPLMNEIFPQYENIVFPAYGSLGNYIKVDGKFSSLDAIYIKQKINYSKNPFDTAKNLLQTGLNDFLLLKDKPYHIPPVVKSPDLPKTITLEKGKFESTASFRKRVESAQKKRQEEILKLQNDYRQKVENRNEMIKKAEDLAKLRLAFSEIFKNFIMRDIINKLFSDFYMANPQYDPDKMDMFVELIGKNADFKRKIALRVPEGEYAESFYNNLNKIPVEVTFEYKDSQIDLYDVKATWQGNSCALDKRAVDFTKPEPMAVVVKNEVKFDALNQKQNPNLVDTSSINIVVYEKSRDSFKDDLPQLLGKFKPSSVDSKKWFFAIGAEKYDNTDPVLYSSRSAEMMVKVAEKVLGVPKSNIYSFIGERATEGAIKSGLKRLVANIKKGDTVYFYYSGHGIPVLPENEPYILPKDSVPDFIADEPEFRLQNIYNTLSESGAGKVVAFVDTCFSGATDGESVYKGVGASRIKPKKVTFDTSKMVVITAGTDTQFSNMYEDKGHRLFSYFVMKSLLNGRKDIKTIYNEVFVKVKDTSFSIGGDNRKQEPVLMGNVELQL